MKKFYLCTTKKNKELSRGVMAALQILILPVKVRIFTGQHKKAGNISFRLFYLAYIHKLRNVKRASLFGDAPLKTNHIKHKSN